MGDPLNIPWINGIQRKQSWTGMGSSGVMVKQEDPHPEEKPWKNQDRLPREAVDESLEMPKVRLDGNWKILG